jgi:hypothetical protein
MIERCADWESLLAALRSNSAARFADANDTVMRAVLAAPCAIAWWIAKRAPELARRDALSLLIVGAEATDAPDEGRWYQLVPTLLGAAFETHVTLVGLELETGFASQLAQRAPAAPAAAFRTGLAAYLSDHACAPDLAFAFHPGLQKHRGWLADDGFPQLLQRAVPLVCAAYEADEYEMERWVVESYGYRADPASLVNPFFLDVSDDKTVIRWGRALWQLQCAPPAGTKPDEERLAALETLNRMVMHSLTTANERAPPYGAAVELASSTGESVRLYHLADNRFLDPASAEVVHLHAGTLKTLKRLPPQIAASYPGAEAPEIERAVWAAGAKAGHLLDSYPPRAVDPSAAAADMLSGLRRKTAALFKGGG